MENFMKTKHLGIWSAVLLSVAAVGCGDDTSSGTGSVSLSIEAEDTIPDGLDPGTELENIMDGWAVRYSKLLFTVGRVTASSSSESGPKLSQPTVYLLDLTQISETGFPLLEQAAVPAIRYDQVSFENPIAADSFKKDPAVSDEDKTMMVDKKLSLYIAGEITNPDGKSCTPGKPEQCVDEPKVSFAWAVAAPTSYTHCGPEEGDKGFAVASGGTTGATFTIHGDHWFFNAFPEGAEIVKRQAQWVADADLDHDGETTVDELKKSRASDLFPSGSYSLVGSPVPVSNGYDFVVAQSHTVGHFQGEGECEWDVQK
jgi:hypothetical protein